MHTIESCIDPIDAGRQPLFTSRAAIYSFPPEIAKLMWVSESRAEKAARKVSEARRKMKAARRSTLKKVARLVDSANPIVTKSQRAAAAQRLAELKRVHEAACLVAFTEENDKNRITLMSMMSFWTPEHFVTVFPPSVKLISDAWVKETSDRIWDELVSASKRK